MKNFIVNKNFGYLYKLFQNMRLTKGFIRGITAFSFLTGLILFISCSGEVVGPVPEFEFEFRGFDTELELDVTTLGPDDAAINPGTVTNSAIESFSSSFANDPTTTTNVTNALNGALNSSQQSFWASLDVDGLVTDIQDADANLISQIQAVITAFQGNTTLSQFIPTVVNPSSNTGNRSSLSFSAIALVDLDDCRQSAQEAYDEALDQLDSLNTYWEAELGDNYDSISDIITSDPLSVSGPAQDRYTTRNSNFKSTYDQFLSNINSASNLQSGQSNLLIVLNKAVYALNLYYSFQIFQTDLSTGLDSSRDELQGGLTDDYNAQLEAINTRLRQAQNSCHNQGANEGT